MRLCCKIIPCFGGLPPLFRALNNAFSAPSTCIVLDGNLASLSIPPALAISLAPIAAPAIAVTFGATLFIFFSTCLIILSLNLAKAKAPSANSFNGSRSSSASSPPLDLSAAAAILEPFSDERPVICLSLSSVKLDPLSYCRLVVELGTRSNFTEDRLKQITCISFEKGSRIAAAAERSRGGELAEEDLEPLKELAEGALALAKLRDRIMRHVEKNMKRVAPNVTAIAGAAIGARLIARAGGMERLARLPSSTIQVLGAEKALFRALKSGGRPPKHGIIFQHNLIHSAQPWQRGKVARALASKIALAARVDFFRGEIDEELAKQTQVKVEEIKKKYPKPKESKPKERRKRRR